MITPSSFSSTLESSRSVGANANQYTTTNPAALYDAELVRRFKDGDEEAFDEIVSRHRGVMFSIALRHLNNHSDAEEIAQDTCFMPIVVWLGFVGNHHSPVGCTELYLISLAIAANISFAAIVAIPARLIRRLAPEAI